MRAFFAARSAGLAVVLLPSLCFAQFDQLTTRAQDGANAVLAIDAQAAKQSPLGQKEGWSKKLDAAFVNRSMFLPPGAKQVLLTSRLLPDRRFERVSEVVQMTMDGAPSLPGIARANGGELDELRGQQCVVLPGDAYLVAFGKDQVGMYSPASRQAAAQWAAGAAEGKGARLSTYLTQALSKVAAGSPIVLALDLADVVSPQAARDRLKAANYPAASIEEAVSQLKTLQGVTLVVSIADRARSRVSIDFGGPITIPMDAAKKLVVSTLEDLGMALDDVSRQTFKASGNSIVIEGDLSSGGFRRIMSLLQLPTAEIPAGDSTAASTTSGDQTAQRSLAYFRTVVSLLDDLRGDRAKQDPRGAQDAVWMDKYAQKIDRLPLLDVDEELLDWGEKTAQTLRVMAGSRRGRSLAAGSQKSGLRTGVSTDSYYNVSVSSATATANDANQIDVQQGNQATATRVEGWRLIDNATAEIRKKETQRYRIEF